MRRTIYSHEKTLLAKGLNLSVPPKKLNYRDFIHPFEQLYSSIEKGASNETNWKKYFWKILENLLNLWVRQSKMLHLTASIPTNLNLNRT